jgi:hypothetical protein
VPASAILHRFSEGQEPPFELLRLRDVSRWLGFSRDELESWESAGLIIPFRKHKTAKAVYRKWQFKKLFNLHDATNAETREPSAEDLRRFDVLGWLGITAAELDSWVRLQIIHPHFKREGEKAYYSKAELKKKVLCLPSKRTCH